MHLSPAQLQAEFGAYLDRTRLDLRLQGMHQVLVAIGMLGCLAVLWFQLQAVDDGKPPSLLARNLVLLASVLNLTVCTLVIMWSQDAQLRNLQQASGSVEDRATRVGVYIRQRGLLLLACALLGHVVVWFAKRQGVRLLSFDAHLVVLNLLPTLQQIYLGFVEVPNRKRLMFLYKLVALHQLRAQRQPPADP